MSHQGKKHEHDHDHQHDARCEDGACCGGGGCTGDSGASQSPAAGAGGAESVESVLEARVAEFESKYLRALADFQNFQRRAGENEVRARQQGAAAIARSLVPALEHFDIAAGHDLAALGTDKLVAAVSMLQEELLKGLAAHGVERVSPAVGDEFNPHFHEAVMQQPVEGVASGHISMCLQAGYRLNEQSIRSAKVAVAP